MILNTLGAFDHSGPRDLITPNPKLRLLDQVRKIEEIKD